MFNPKVSLLDPGPSTPWTTARCERLLRHVETNIGFLEQESKLRDEKNKQFTHVLVEEELSREGNGTYLNSEEVRGLGKVHMHEGVVQPGPASSVPWSAARNSDKRLKRTYTSKGKSKVKTQYQTPKDSFQLDMPSYVPRTPPNQVIQRLCETKHRQLPRSCSSQGKELSLDVNANDFHVSNNLAISLPIILKQTRIPSTDRDLGAKSLFSTCLALIPESINGEEDVLSEESKDFLSADVYREIEEFGSSGAPGSGCSYLGEIVRHHTILLLSNAIREGAIGVAGAGKLINISICEDAAEAAQSLLEGVLSHVDTPVNTAGDLGTPSSYEKVLDILRSFCEGTGRLEYGYQWFAQLLEESRLPSFWLSSQFTTSALNNIMGSLTHQDRDTTGNHQFEQAAALLRTIIRRSYAVGAMASSEAVHTLRLNRSPADCSKLAASRYSCTEDPAYTDNLPPGVFIGDQQDRSSNLSRVSASVLSTLSAINILNHTIDIVSQGPSRKRCMATLQEMGLEARQIVQVALVDRGAHRQSSNLSSHAMLPLLAAGLADLVAYEHTSMATSSTSTNFSTIASLSPSPTAIKRAGSFLYAVASDCAKGEGTSNVFLSLRKILGLLEHTPALMGGPRSIFKILNDIKVAASFAFCDDDPQPAHLEWAMSLEQTVNLATDASAFATPIRRLNRYPDQYRWEEGISEWAKRTPIALSSKSDTLPATASTETHVPTSVVSTSMGQQAPLSAIKPRKEKIAQTAINKTSYLNIPCARIPLEKGPGSEANQPETDIQNVSQTAPDKFQMIISGTDSDSDELSISDGSLRRTTRLRKRPRLRPLGLKLHRSYMSTTRPAQCTQHAEVSSGKAPRWIKKRTSLGFKQEAEDAEDELGWQ